MSETTHDNKSDAALSERTKKPLREAIQSALDAYFKDLDGHTPNGLYHMVLAEIEQPLLQTVMKYTRGNQSKAAELLGINRSTLHKKLTQYGLD